MESLLGGLGGAAAGMTVSAAHKHMLQAQPSLRDPSKGTSLYLCVRAVRVCACVCVCVCACVRMRTVISLDTRGTEELSVLVRCP